MNDEENLERVYNAMVKAARDECDRVGINNWESTTAGCAISVVGEMLVRTPLFLEVKDKDSFAEEIKDSIFSIVYLAIDNIKNR